MMRLEDKVALIIGAGAGIGKSTALRFGEEGAKVVIIDIDEEAGRKVKSMIEEIKGVAAFFPVDVRNSSKVNELIDDVVKRYGRIDILVNNVGRPKDAFLIKMTEEDWDLTLELNLKSVFLFSRKVAPVMIEQKYGKIINITSMAYQGNPGQANYAAAKSGIVGFTKSLAKELGRFNVNVNAVSPGVIDTPLLRSFDEKVIERLLKDVPLRRIGEPLDVANTILFLSTDESKYITGQVLHVSGGLTVIM
jgi:3-oxoacyl-[acyl-carrier protein] reductase